MFSPTGDRDLSIIETRSHNEELTAKLAPDCRRIPARTCDALLVKDAFSTKYLVT